MTLQLEQLQEFVHWIHKDLDTFQDLDWLDLNNTLPISVSPVVGGALLIEIKQIIEAIANNDCWMFTESGTEQHVIGRVKEHGNQVLVKINSSNRSQTLLWFFKIMEAEGHRLKRCPECKEKRIFVKIKRQEYCSKSCSQRVRTRRFMENYVKREAARLVSKRDSL